MAIYYLAVSNVRRAEGRSVVAAAAYRAGVRLLDERTGEIFDYRPRSGVEAVGLVGWTSARSALWNDAERAEKRRDAVVGREVVVALPHELPPEARLALVVSFAGWLRERHGVAVDWAIHAPSDDGDERNTHAHLLLTSRCAENGALTVKTRELDDRRRSRLHIEAWRMHWAERCNDVLNQHGIGGGLDHRSHRRQAKATGLPEREAQQHLGPARTRRARGGAPVRRALDNGWAIERNRAIGSVQARLAQTARALADLLTAQNDEQVRQDRQRD